MMRKVLVVLSLTLIVAGLWAGPAAAQTPQLDLPPGIAKQAQPLLVEMMTRMGQMHPSEVQMQMMMADMQTMADRLPPGIFLQLLKSMLKLDMNDMMALHQKIHQGDLLQQPPGQILRFVQGLAR